MSHSTIRWLHECIRFDGTNNNVWDCHIFNGMKDYLAADRTSGTPLDQALADYFAISLASVPTTDFTVRTKHALVVTAGTSLSTKDNTFNDCYFDNGTMEHYSDRVHYNNPSLGSKVGSSIGPQYWWKFYAHGTEVDPQCKIQGVHMLVESVEKTLVQFVSHDGNTWGADFSDFETENYNLGSSSAWGDGFELSPPSVRIGTRKGTDDRTIQHYHAPQSRAFIGFSDNFTSQDGNSDFEVVKIGGRGDDALLRSEDLILESKDGTDENLRVTQYGDVRFRALAAEPTVSANGDLALSDGTASTNGFGDYGEGHYRKAGGSWFLLPEYSSGTWTPVFSDASSNDATFGGLRGTWSKVGNQVTLNVFASNIDTTGMTSTDILEISGQPFAWDTNASNRFIGVCQLADTTITGQVTAQISGAIDHMRLAESVTGAAFSFINVQDLTTTSADIHFSITYLTAI